MKQENTDTSHILTIGIAYTVKALKALHERKLLECRVSGINRTGYLVEGLS